MVPHLAYSASPIFGISHGVGIDKIWEMPNMEDAEPWEI